MRILCVSCVTLLMIVALYVRSEPTTQPATQPSITDAADAVNRGELKTTDEVTQKMSEAIMKAAQH